MDDSSTCAHYWRVSAPDADPGSDNLPATCARCGAPRQFPRALPTLTGEEAFNARRGAGPRLTRRGTHEDLGSGGTGRHAIPAPLGRRDPSARMAS